MSDLTTVLADFVRLFDELAMDYAVMGRETGTGPVLSNSKFVRSAIE